MRRWLTFLWLCTPVVWACLHYGPGVRWRRNCEIAAIVDRAEQCEKQGNWRSAQQQYEKAIASLPKEHFFREECALRRAHAMTFLNTADVARSTHELEKLLKKVLKSPQRDDAMEADVRAALAHAEYYTAWHMRLEKCARKDWLEELDTSRQNLRLLAETGQSSVARYNLEAAITLARQDIDKLKTMPFPKKNAGRDSTGVGRARAGQKGKKKGKGKGKGEGDGEGDGEGKGKVKDSRGQGLGKRPDGIGS